MKKLNEKKEPVNITDLASSYLQKSQHLTKRYDFFCFEEKFWVILLFCNKNKWSK